jgi:hypothetical protein
MDVCERDGGGGVFHALSILGEEFRSQNSRGGIQKSEFRIQNAVDVRFETSTGFFKQKHGSICLAVLQILCEDQIIPALFKRGLRDIQKAYFVSPASAFEAFSYVGGNRYGGATHLAGECELFMLWKT